MSELRDLLEQERRRFRLPNDSFNALERRRKHKQRNRRTIAGLVAVLIAVGGVGGGLYAFLGKVVKPVGPSPTSTPSMGPVRASVALLSSGPIEFVDDRHGWVVIDGRVLSTSDAGKTWQPREVRSSPVNAVDFVDLLHGWALSDGGLFRTTNGGVTWQDVSNDKFSMIQFLTPLTGWGVEALPHRRLLRTTDGGKTWKFESVQVDSVCASPDENVVWAAGPGRGGVSFLKSVDGGVSWVDTPIALPQGRAAGAFVSCAGIDAWVLVETGGAALGNYAYALFRTGEGGPTAYPVLQQGYTRPLGNVAGLADAPGGYPGPLAIVDGVHARFVTYSPSGGPVTVLVTNNPSKVDWISAIVTHQDWTTPLGVSFVSRNLGWALLSVGGAKPIGPEILKTTDGGMTWTPTCESNLSSCLGTPPS